MLAVACILLFNHNVQKQDTPCCPGRLLHLSSAMLLKQRCCTAGAALKWLPKRLVRAVNAVKGLLEVSECYCNALNHVNGQHTRLGCFVGVWHCTADLIANENKQRSQR